MAEPVHTNPLELSPERIARLKELEGREVQAKEQLKVLKSLGVDTQDLDDKLAWAENVRKTLLRQAGEE